jgi:two-component system, response regulator FlrC
MPGLSLAKTSYRSGSFELSAEQIEAVRQLVGRTIAEVECELIIETLVERAGSRTNAARVLGISLRTLRNKINEYTACGKIVPGPSAKLSAALEHGNRSCQSLC